MTEEKFLNAERYIEKNYKQLPLPFSVWKEEITNLLVKETGGLNWEGFFGMSDRDLYIEYFGFEMSDLYGKNWLAEFCLAMGISECDAVFVLTNVVMSQSGN